MKDDLLFSNEFLKESSESFIFDIATGDDTTSKGDWWQERGITQELIGKITFDPSSTRISPLPSPNYENDPLWDFYFIYIPFNLHPTYENRKYQKVTFFVELTHPQTTAFDLFPKNVTVPIDETRGFVLSPQLKFGEIETNLGQISREIQFTSLHPSITALGEGERIFYWLYSSNALQDEVLPGCKHALIVLRVPRGLTTVEGKIAYEVVTARRLGVGWRYVNGKTPPLPISWKLDRTSPPTPISIIQPNTPQIAPVVRPPAETLADVCIVCALPEEVDAFKEMTEQICQTRFTAEVNVEDKQTYYSATIQNNVGESLRIHVSYPPYNGPEEIGLHVKPLLKAFQPRLAAMVGICAGDRAKVELGDLVVADRAFLYETGKFVRNKEGQTDHFLDTTSWSMDLHTLHEVRTFRSWETDVMRIPRPPSKLQQRDWLLSKLLKPLTPAVDSIPLDEMGRFAPAWREIVFQLQQGSQPLLTADLKLVHPQVVQRMQYGREIFPHLDPVKSRCHIAPMASGHAVRCDAPFKEIQIPVRNALSIDMEGATFYRTVAEFPGIHSLLVKGVSDYADTEKDDSYHRYAAAVSSLYALSFIKEHVTLARMPRSF